MPIIVLIFTGCASGNDRSTNTYSSSFNNYNDKIAFMEEYYSPPFKYEDVEYYINYHDNGSGRGAPGPSDWYMQFAFKVDSSVLVTLSEQEETTPFSIDKRIDFLPKNDKWNIDGAKKYYKNGDVIIIENNILLREEYTR